jgi:hypothetical protein
MTGLVMGCHVADFDPNGHGCPCLAGYVCEAGVCVAQGQRLGTNIELEAEAAELIPPMAIEQDGTASGGKAISTSEAEKGSAKFAFTVATSGQFVVWARTLAFNDGANSFYVSMDADPETVYELPVSTTFVYSRVNTQSVGTPKTFTLSAGPHTLTVRGREVGAILDKIIITADSSFVPAN